jgi:DNA-binding MarR family transcriptional regulator
MAAAAAVKEEIRQNKPFESLEQEVFLTLLWSADRLQWRLNETLRTYGLSPTQYNALRILRGAGKQGLACSEVAERMITRDPDITRLFDRMGKMGLVQRKRASEDRRVVVAQITVQGLALLKKLDPVVQSFLRTLLGHMGTKNLRALLESLQKVDVSV